MSDDRPRLLASKCSSCVFRPGNPMSLAPGRLRDLVASNLGAGSVLTCHQTLPYGGHPGTPEAMCRGYFDRYADRSNVVRIMRRLMLIEGREPDAWFVEVEPPD